ncbi:MAG: hypothetical protein MUF21_11025 [Gemmatimonadaceae bacterium]|nr:hypothetical protein [Gemmatimonadaceae bacterium]
MHALAAAVPAAPRRAHGDAPVARLEAPVVCDPRAVAGHPAVAPHPLRHHAVARAAEPGQRPARREHACELAQHARIVGGIGEEAERGEEVEHRVEAPGPLGRERAHVAAHVAQRAPGAASPRDVEQRLAVVEPRDVEAGFGEQVCVPSLPARAVEDPRAIGEREQLHEARDLAAIALLGEERFELADVVTVEVRGPPVGVGGAIRRGRAWRA